MASFVEKFSSDVDVDKLRNPCLRIVKWKRFPEKLDFSVPKQSLVCGPKGAGKSSLIETLSSIQGEIGTDKIIDLFSARDCEGLSFLRHKRWRNGVLLLRGPGTKIASEYDDADINTVTLRQLEDYQTIISVPRFYSSPEEEWEGLSKFLKTLWDRPCWTPKHLWSINIREGINLGSSRLKLGDSQVDAKSQLIYALNQFRHCGYTVNMDTLRLKSIDINIREICDYIFIKKQGIFGLPDDLKFLYRPYDLVRDIMRIPKYGFIILTTDGGIGHGVFQKPYWHKETHEDMLSLFDIELEFEDAPEEGKGDAVGDLEHAKIVALRFDFDEEKGKTLSVAKIAKKVSRSMSTVQGHINSHNEEVSKNGSCSKCVRAKSEYAQTHILRHCLRNSE